MAPAQRSVTIPSIQVTNRTLKNDDVAAPGRFMQLLVITGANWGAGADPSPGFQPAEVNVHTYISLHPPSAGDPEFSSYARS